MKFIRAICLLMLIASNGSAANFFDFGSDENFFDYNGGANNFFDYGAGQNFFDYSISEVEYSPALGSSSILSPSLGL